MLSSDEFRLFQRLIYEESGICLRDDRQSFLHNRLAKRFKATGLNSPYRYYRLLTQGTTTAKQELLILLDSLTINETSFFRNQPQFLLLRGTVLPEIIHAKTARDQHTLRIWSAGCSTGQEPYSIAIVLLETIPYLRLWDVKVLASDLSLTALEAAQQARYPREKIPAVPADWLAQYFHADGDHYVVRKEVKDLVVFDFHNLKHENGLADLDIIFCRNVLIYFDQAEQRKLIDKFYRSLTPGGYLFLGHAETLHGLSNKFRFIHRNKGTAYQRLEVAEVPSSVA
ncbi:MAG: CheR family methyltransferase [Candidatus Methylomirabilales bacterium]